MDFNIRITGPAWLWINSTADIVTSIFANLGYKVITDIEYESRIKWWVNYFDIFVSDNKPFLTKYCDVILAFNKESLEKNIVALKKNWVAFCNEKIKNTINEETKTFIEKNDIKLITLEINDKYDNTYLLALFSYYFSLDTEIVKESISEIFAKKWQATIEANNKIFENAIWWLSFEKSKITFTKIWEKLKVSYWNKMIAYGMIDAKLEYYSAYPMTPASSVLTEIINSKKVTYLQAEDEIAVINSALWASFTGARSAVWTSWWWFALMAEALSFAIEAEFPIVAILSQRAGPSTGTPTYHETWDINFALNPTFWDFNHIVLTPSTLEEAHYFAWVSLNLADKYQSVVILLVDKQLSEIAGSIWELQKVIIDRWVILENPPVDYKRYELTESGISPRVIVGTKNWDFISSSYEHDEYWATTEDTEMKKLMTEKRWKKLENFFEKEGISGFEVYNPPLNLPLAGETFPNSPPAREGLGEWPKKMIVTFSGASYTAKKFVDENPEFWLVIIKYLKPLDARLLEVLKDKEEVIFAESNYSGQLEKYICNELWLRSIKWLKISNLRKYDLFPFYIEDFNSLIWK